MDSEERKQYTEANRSAWNEVTPIHQQSAKEKWDTAFRQPGYSCIDAIEHQMLMQVPIQRKDIAHLCCNNGVELLSLKNLGAGKCVGFDICDEAIREATERAELCSIDCRFIRTDVYNISEGHNGQFDMIYISVGCLGWLPDLPSFFMVAARLLRENGWIFIHEAHPFAELLPNDSENKDPLRIAYPYFKKEPYIEYGDLDYLGKVNYNSQKPQYWFTHTMSEILMGLIDNHFTIKHFSEYDVDIANIKMQIDQMNAGVPLSYILVGEKIE